MDKQEQKLSLRRKVLVSIAILPAIALFVFSLASLIGVTISLPPSGEERSSGQAMIFISAVMIFLSCVGALSVIMLGWRHDRSQIDTILLALLVCMAALSLLWLRRIELSLFLCALGVDLLIAASHLSQTGWLEELWGPGSVLKLIIHVYVIAPTVFTLYLRQVGGPGISETWIGVPVLAACILIVTLLIRSY